jgi:aryl-alcohol dehydrogenase-like predicted oxidoreductase
VAKIDAVQWEYSLMSTDVETNGVLDACKELGVTLVAYSPLCELSFSTRFTLERGLGPAADQRHACLLRFFLTGRGLIGLVGDKWLSPADIPSDDFRRHLPRFQGDAFDANLKLVRKLKEIAAAKSITVGQLALAWVIDQGAIPIPGTKRREYLEENIKAVEVKISKEEHVAIRAILKEVQVKGDRYPDLTGTNA